MALWKKKEKKQPSPPQEPRPPRPSPAMPRHALVWIDASYADLPVRCIRGLALAEAFKQAAVPQVTLACLPIRPLPAEAEKRAIHWLNIRPNDTPVLFHEILKSTQADLVIADCPTPPRFQPAPLLALFALVSDLFSEALLVSPAVDSLLIPGLACPPDFSSLILPPSRLADCFHGTPYIPLLKPSNVGDHPAAAPAATGEKPVMIAVPGNVNPESVRALMECVREPWKGPIQILADVPPSAGERLREIQAGEITVLHEPSPGDRWKAIGAAQVIVSFPGLPVYEFLSSGKPVILLPRSGPEESICRLLESRGAARVVAAAGSVNREKLRDCFNELIQDETLRKNVEQKAKEIVEDGGARNAVNLWLHRYRLRAGMGKNT